MELQNKLLVNVGGRPLIAAAVEGAVASGLAPWWSSSAISAMQCARSKRLARHYRREYELPGRPERFRSGPVSPPCRPVLMAWLLCWEDMPQVRPSHIHSLVSAFEVEGRAAICVPTYAGRRGNPVLWGADYLPDLMSLTGDAGGRMLFARYAARVRESGDAGQPGADRC